MFVRAGGFIFSQPVVQSVDEMPGNPLEVLIAPAKSSASWFYQDDGLRPSLAIRRARFMKRQFSQTRDAQQTVIAISAPDGSYHPAQRELVLKLWADHEPKNVLLKTGGKTSRDITLPKLAGNTTTDSASGWSCGNGLLTIKTPDSIEPMQFTVDGISQP